MGPWRLRLAGCLPNLALLVGSIAVLGIGLEIATRLFGNASPPIHLQDPVVGKRYIPGLDRSVFVPESGRTVRLRFNREGFRGPDVSIRKPPGTVRIALVGDSFVAAVACDEEDTATRRLQRLLERSDPDTRWEVLNFGVSSSSTGQELVLDREVVARYAPDVVIVAYSTYNDFADNSNRLSTFRRIYFELDENGTLRQLPFSASRSKITAWLNRHSRFYVWQKSANDVLWRRVDRAVGGPEAVSTIYRTDDDESLRSAWELNLELVEAFHRQVEGRGARFALAVLPAAAQVYDDVWRGVVEEAGALAPHYDREFPEERIVGHCRSKGIPVVPMLDAFRAAAPSRSAGETDPVDLLFFDGTGHFTEKGNRIAAETLHGFLTTRVLSSSLRAPPSGP